MNDNKKPSEPLEVKELLTHQLQLVSKESEEAHGETLAALSSAIADLAQALAACSRTLTCVLLYSLESAPKTHTLTIDEIPHHTFDFGTSGAHTNSVSPYASTAGSEWLAAEQDTHT